jgi:hypothetical protein
MSNNKAGITTKQEEQQSMNNNEVGGATKKQGGVRKWGQVGPLLQKNGKLISEAYTEGGVEETIEKLHHPKPKIKTKIKT